MSPLRVIGFCLLLALPSSALAQAPTLEECEARVRASPEAPDTYYCFVLAARGHGVHELAARRLEEIWQAFPERHRALLNLAVIEHQLGHERAGDLYAAAAEAASGRDDAWGVVYARTGHADWLRARGEAAAADSELAAAQEAAEASGDSFMLGHVLAMRGGAALADADPGLALRFFQRAEGLVFPDGPAYLKSWILSGLGGIRWALQDQRGAISIYEREADLLRASGDAYGLAVPLVNRALSALLLYETGQLDAAEHGRYVREALAAALDGRNRYEEARARTQQGLLLESEPAIAEFEKAASLARSLGNSQIEGLALRLAAREHAATADPDHREGAEKLASDALEASLDAGDTIGVLGALLVRAEVARIFGTREEFISRALEAVRAAERLRSRQRVPEIRAQVFASAGEAHVWLATWLLATLDSSRDPGGDLALAFEMLERRRARELLESLAEVEGGAGTVFGVEHGGRLEEIWSAISGVQRRLLERDLPADARRDAGKKLAALEAEEFALVDEVAATSPTIAAATLPRLASLGDVQSSLAPDQALLYFARGTERSRSMQIDGAGSWLLVLTSVDLRTYPVPDERDLRGPLSAYRGLVRARSPLAGRAGARVYAALLADAVDGLPEMIKRIVIVPEYDLADVPLAPLSPSPDLPSLAERFEIALAPSATLWMRLRAPERTASGGVLSLAKPIVQPRHGGAKVDPWWGGRLPPLPDAEREVAGVQRSIEGGTARFGTEASETYVKSGDLGSFGVLHLATHALIDVHSPGRSAIFLSPGSEREDGLLQPREIASLDLAGKLVILSACSSASGEAVRGEGLMGLSHAFFRAGARTIIGTLWPVRDDEAADFVEEMAARLGHGETVGASLAGAQRAMIRRGMPPASWAGFVVLGDGGLSPAIPKAASVPALVPLLVVALSLAAVLAIAGLMRRRGATRP